MPSVFSKLSEAILLREWSFPFNCYEIGHTWEPSCTASSIELSLGVAQKALTMYTGLYTFNLLFSRNYSLSSVQQTGTSILRSTTFLGFNSIAMFATVCILRKLTGRFYYSLFATIPAQLGSFMAILIEQPSRRRALAFHCANIATECCFRIAAKRGRISSIPHGEVILFTIAMSILMYIGRVQGLRNDPIGLAVKIILGSSEFKRKSNDHKSGHSVPLATPSSSLLPSSMTKKCNNNFPLISSTLPPPPPTSYSMPKERILCKSQVKSINYANESVNKAVEEEEEEEEEKVKVNNQICLSKGSYSSHNLCGNGNSIIKRVRISTDEKTSVTYNPHESGINIIATDDGDRKSPSPSFTIQSDANFNKIKYHHHHHETVINNQSIGGSDLPVVHLLSSSQNDGKSNHRQQYMKKVHNLLFDLKHSSCQHGQSCTIYLARGFLQTFAATWLGQSVVDIVMKGTRLRRDPWLIYRSLTNRKKANFTLFVSLFTLIFRTTNCSLRWYTGQRSAWHNAVAGLMAGPTMILQPNSVIASNMIWKCIEYAVDIGEKSGYPIKADTIIPFLYALSVNIMFYTLVLEPDCLRPSLIRFIDQVTDHRLHQVNRSLLSLFGTNAQIGYEEYFPDLHPAFCSRQFLETVLVWRLEG
ncbi:transmembrane protein 135-like [Brevipalpus obovatus]|uniref:transmembrane protein 135-like n=1 Tax=Brevipalpus obovatus TaxID=246614 RepID=UPI003D9F9880